MCQISQQFSLLHTCELATLMLTASRKFQINCESATLPVAETPFPFILFFPQKNVSFSLAAPIYLAQLVFIESVRRIHHKVIETY